VMVFLFLQAAHLSTRQVTGEALDFELDFELELEDFDEDLDELCAETKTVSSTSRRSFVSLLLWSYGCFLVTFIA
jgi:hypothetical protein